MELEELDIKKDLASFQERNRLHRATKNGAWLSAVTHRLNSVELSREEFRDNLCLRYGLMPQYIPATFDVCGKRFSIEHVLSLPKVGLVLARNFDAAKEWGALGARSLVPSTITYEPKINRSKLKGERTGARAWQDGGTAKVGAYIVGESQGVLGQQ